MKKYFDIFIKDRKTGVVATFRMCENLNIAFDKSLGAYIFEFFMLQNHYCVNTKYYVITID